MWAPLVFALALAQPAPAHYERCTLRITSTALYLDGDRTTRGTALAACKRLGEAVVILDDPRAAEWPTLRNELEAAHVKILLRGLISDSGPDCLNNPLAKGCN